MGRQRPTSVTNALWAQWALVVVCAIGAAMTVTVARSRGPRWLLGVHQVGRGMLEVLEHLRLDLG